MSLALFHTTADMMTVILRNDLGSDSLTLPPAKTPLISPSPLFSMHIRLAPLTPSSMTVWHTGCPNHRCEGLRVLGTSQTTGWGLGITEIGRTGISSPHNCSRCGYWANPQQIIKALISTRTAGRLRGRGAAEAGGPFEICGLHSCAGRPSGNFSGGPLHRGPTTTSGR